MADGAALAAAPATPKAKAEFKEAITITFGAKEKSVYEQIVKDANEEDRTEAKYLAIWLRENYKK